MKRSYLEDEEIQAFKTGNDLLSISNRYKKMAMTQLKYGEALTKCITLMDELKELKKDASCPVCYKSFMVKVTGKCDHSVCVDCYRNLVYPKKCPLCRINFENEVDDEDEDETLEREDDDDDETYDSLEDVLNVGLDQRISVTGTGNSGDLDTEATRGGGL